MPPLKNRKKSLDWIHVQCRSIKIHQVYAVARLVRRIIHPIHPHPQPTHIYFLIIEPQQGTICRNIFAIISFTVAGCLLWAWYYDQLPPDQQQQANTTGLEWERQSYACFFYGPWGWEHLPGLPSVGGFDKGNLLYIEYKAC